MRDLILQLSKSSIYSTKPRETLKAVFETVMGILPDAETLRGQGYPAFAVEKGSLICTRHTLID